MVTVDPAQLEHVPAPRVDVRVNEDLDRKALRFEKALEECNARLDDIAASQAAALDDAQRAANESKLAPWWRRLFGS